MLRRLHKDQPDSFAFTPANQAWADAQISKYPEGRQASAVIPLLWRAQEQEGWLSRPAMEHIAGMLSLAYIRVLEVATFYFMFQLQPVGSVANIQICGTTSCMICGAEELVSVCKKKIASSAHTLSADGKFSWEEVECLGACANAPMAQIGKDYYEDLTAEKLGDLIDALGRGEVPAPGPQNGRYASEPASGLTSLKDYAADKHQFNASAQLATDIGDTVKRIDGTEVPLRAPWRDGGSTISPAEDRTTHEAVRQVPAAVANSAPAEEEPDPTPMVEGVAEETIGEKPEGLATARGGISDDLKKISGVGPKLEKLLHSLGFFHFDQVAAWTENEIAWVDDNLEGFKGRVTRDEWVVQARKLAEEHDT